MSVSAEISQSAPAQNSYIRSNLRHIQKECVKTKKYIVKNAAILGRMDGWDEAAVAASTVLPAYARPLFLFATLTGLTVPVSWGAQGMAAEFQEMKDNVQGLKNTQVDLALRLLASKNTPKDIKEQIKEEFDENNKHNKKHLEHLSDVLNKIYDDKKQSDYGTDKQKADEIKKAFQKLDININDSDDHIEGLLKNDASKDTSKKTEYNTVKEARDLIAQYKEGTNKDKITQFIDTYKNKVTFKQNDSQIQKLQKISDSILEPRRERYIIKLFNDYNRELENKAELKTSLDNTTNTEPLLKTLNITPASNAKAVQSDYLQYEKNKRDIAVEQTPLTSYLGNAAMCGMTLGTALSAAKAGTQLAQQFGIFPNITPALTAGLDLASSGTFIASQAAMVGYGLGQAYKGMQKNNDLNNDIALLKENIGIKQGTEPTNAQQEKLDYLTQLKTYNSRKNTVYGIGIAAAEAGMIAGSLTGSSPLLMASALGTLAFAGLRMVTQSAEAKLTGNAHDHEHNGKPITLLLNPWKKPEIERAIDDTGSSKTVDVCGDANCKTEHGSFELDDNKLNKSYDMTVKYNSRGIGKSLENFKEKLIFVNASELQLDYIKTVKAMIESRFQEEKNDTNGDLLFIDALFDNPTALEEAKEILIDKFEDDDSKKDSLKVLNSKRLDADALNKLLQDNLTLLDKPQNAKRILKPLLEERIEKLTAKKHNLIQNMVHLQRSKKPDTETKK